MTQPDEQPTTGRRRATRKRRPSLRLRWFVVGALVFVLVLGAAAAWVGVRGLAAKNHLVSAQRETTALRAALLDDKSAAAQVQLAAVQNDTSKARSLTGDPVWRAAAHLPWVGSSAGAVTTTSAAVDEVAQQVLPTLVEQADALAPSKIRVAGDRLDLTTIAAAAPQLAAASTQARAAADKAASVDAEGLPNALGDAVTKAQNSLDQVADLTTNAAEASRLMPGMLGADGPRRYLLAFQSNAETRATGGLIGAYAVLEADNGKLSVKTLGPRSKLDKGNLDKPAIDFGADYTALYGDDPALWVNTNLSPHFPYAAQLWLAMYEKQTGQRLDGAIATDPVALGYTLAATGPAALADGTTVTAENAAKLTMSDVYARYPDSDAKRDAFLQDVARAVMTNLLAGQGDSAKLASQLGRAAGERRLLVYSDDAAEQKVLAATPLGGSVAASPGPYVGVFTNSGSASKLDYYLDAAVDYSLSPCTSAKTRKSSITLTMANTAPESGLPSYVTGPKDANGNVSNTELVAVHLPAGATLASATLDGKTLGVSPQRLLGRPVVTFPLTLVAGQKAVVELNLAEPKSDLVPKVEVQALATPFRTSIADGGCSS